MYQIAPDKAWGFNVAASLTGRQGYPILYYRRLGATTRGEISGSAEQNIQLVKADQFRNDNIHTMDARIEKEFTFSDVGLTLGVDCFNLLNDGTVLQRNARLGGTGDYAQEVLSPRIFRIGARLSFR
jgi:hypothetical protein